MTGTAARIGAAARIGRRRSADCGSALRIGGNALRIGTLRR
jgi:hypothetical protein